MKYRDAEIYLNNPTLSPENEGDYQSDSIFQIGLLTSLPPAAAWIIQRARAADKTRNVLYRIRNYERNVRMGTHFTRNFKAQSIINETRVNQEFYEYTRAIEELRAEESSIDADYEEIAKKRQYYEDKVRRLVQDVNEKPYTVYRNGADREVAQFREAYTRDQEFEWQRSANTGETFQEASRRLEALRVIVEQRHVVEPATKSLDIKNLTTSGQRAFRQLAGFLKDSFGVNIENIDSNPQDFENIKVYKGSTGMYRYEITLPQSYGPYRKFQVELPAFHGDYQIQKYLEEINKTPGRSFDGRLMSRFAAQNVYEVGGQMRVAKFGYEVGKGKTNVMKLAWEGAYGQGGRFDGTLNYVSGIVARFQKATGPKDTMLLINEMATAIRNFGLDETFSEAIEKGYEQEISPAALIFEPPKMKLEEAEKAAEREYAMKRSGIRGESAKDIKTKAKLRYLASITENPIFIQYGGQEIEITNLETSATLSGSTGVAERAKIIATPKNMRFQGGHRQGQQALRTNLALGFNVNSVVKKAFTRVGYVEYYEKRKALRERMRQLRMKFKSAKSLAESMSPDQETIYNRKFESFKKRRRRISSFLARAGERYGLERYDIANQKWMTVVEGSPLEGHQASFRVRRALITYGDDISNAFGTTRDQSITISRYGVNFSDIYNNPNVDLVQVTNSIAYVTDHTVTFDKEAKTVSSRRVKKGQQDSLKSSGQDKSGQKIFKNVTRKLQEAEKKGSPMILVTKEEAQALDIPVSEGMRVREARGTSVEFKTPHYVVLFEKRYTENPSLSQYRFAGEYNTKNILGNVTKESSKSTNKIMGAKAARQMVDTVFSNRVSGDPEVALARAAATSLEKGFIDQIASADFLIGKGYNLQLNEGIFRRILSQMAENELSSISDISKYVQQTLKGQVGDLDSRQSIIHINGAKAKGSGFYEAAEDLFAKIILGRERVKGERFISSLSINRVNSSGEVTVGFKLSGKALQHWKNSQSTTIFLEMIKKKNVSAMKEVNDDLNKIISYRMGQPAGERNKDLFFGYVDEAPAGSTYVNRVINAVKGEFPGKDSKSMFLDIMFGQGVAQGHDFYPNYAKPIYGKNFYEGGPTFDYIEISGMKHINRAMAAQLSNMMGMNIERNFLSRSAALSFNKSINKATRENQNEDARRLTQAAKKNYRNTLSLLDEVTYMTKDAFLSGDTAIDVATKSERIKKRKVGELTISETLEKYKLVKGETDIGSRANALMKALGLDNFYIDQEDEVRLKKLYNEKGKVVQEVAPGTGLRVAGIELAEDIRLRLFRESFEGNPKTDLLFYNIPRPEDIGEKVTSEDIHKLGMGLLGEAKEKVLERQRRILKASVRDGVINVKHMTGGAQKHLQLEILNKVSWMIKKGMGNASEETRQEMKELMEAVKFSIERIGNDMIQEEAEQVGFGKNSQEMFKVTPAYSASLNLSRYDDIQSAWSKIAEQRGFHGQELEWNAVILNKKQVTEMANSKMVSASRALNLVSNFSSNKIGASLMAAELQNLSKDFGFGVDGDSPIHAFIKDFQGIEHTEEEIRKGKYSRSARKLNAQLERLSKVTKSLQKIGFKSWESVNKATMDKSVVGVESIRKLFSKEGFYKKIETHLSKEKYQGDVANAWKNITSSIEELGMLRKRKTKGGTTGRFYKNWKSIGQRLNEKNTWSLINNALEDAIKGASGEELEDIKLLKQSLGAAMEEEKEFQRQEQKVRSSRKGSGPKSVEKGIATLYKQFERKFGKNYNVLELMERAGVDAVSLKSYIESNKGAPSQLDSFEANVQKAKSRIAKDFVGFELLTNRLQSLVSFSNEEELLKLRGMTDKEIEQLAKNKTRALIKQSIDLANQIKNSSASSEAKNEFRKRIIEFQRELKGVKGERGLVQELTEAFKFFKGTLGEGVTGIQGVNPNIMADKHMKQVIIRTVLGKELAALGKSGKIENADVLMAYMKQNSIKVGALFQSILDRDFDGDRLKIMANIIDRRWGSSKESIVTSNVLGFMHDSSFSYSEGRLAATNVYSARNIEWITNEKFKAKEIVLEKVEDYVNRVLKREVAVHGQMEFKPGESITGYLDRKQKEVLDEWIFQNHGKHLKGKDREKALAEGYILVRADTITSTTIKDQGDALAVKFLKGGERTATLLSKSTLQGAYTEGYVIDLLNRLGGGANLQEEKYLDRTYNILQGKDLRQSALDTISKVSDAATDLVYKNAKQFLDETNQIRGDAAKVFMTQKSVTGELYKFPMMMRALGAALAENNVGKLGQMGQAMSEVASYAGYMFEQHIAIGIKKGGQDAAEGVKNLYLRMNALASIEDGVERSKLIGGLYKELTTVGLSTTPTPMESKQITKSGFAEKILRKTDTKMFGSLELLKFGEAKQMVIEDLLAENKNGKKVPSEKALNFLLNSFQDSVGKTPFSKEDAFSVTRKLRAEVIKEMRDSKAKADLAAKEAGKGAGTVTNRSTLVYMLDNLSKLNQDTAEMNKAYINFGKFGITSSVSLLKAAKDSGFMQEYKKITALMGDVSKDASERDFVMDLVTKMDKEGMAASSFGRSFIEEIGNNSALGKQDLDLIKSIIRGRKGKEVRVGISRKVNELFSKNAYRNGAIAALGVLAVGTFAPDVSVGAGRDSYIDKRPEIESELPRKMLAQYSNQANVSYVPPWVSERIRAEKREKASYNSMFFGSLTG